MKTTIAILATLAFALASASTADADTFYAYSGNIEVGSPQDGGTNPDGKGRQTLGNLALGLDFTVTDESGIMIYALGIWDDNGDGLLSPHTLSVYDLDDESLLASIDTVPGEGTLVDGFRYFDLPTGLSLEMGRNFTMAAYYGPGNQDSNGNSGAAIHSFEPNPTFDGGFGLIENNGRARYGVGNHIPLTLDYGPENRYHAGSFEYTPNPEPGTMVLLGGAAAVGGYIRRRRRKKLQQTA